MAAYRFCQQSSSAFEELKAQDEGTLDAQIIAAAKLVQQKLKIW